MHTQRVDCSDDGVTCEVFVGCHHTTRRPWIATVDFVKEIRS
jgi:hypothetical protein